MDATILRQFTILLFFVLNFSDALAEKTCKVPNGDGGVCTMLGECDPLYQLNKKDPKTPEEDMFLLQAFVSCKDSEIEICCPPKSQWNKLVITPVKESHNSSNPSSKHLELAHDNADNISSNAVPILSELVPEPTFLTDFVQPFKIMCGVHISAQQQILGGTATEIDEFPWLALLEYEPKKFKCGGSLISKSHVLTAAHCLYTPPSQVRLSEYNLTSDPTDTVELNGGDIDYITVTVMKIDWTRQHPDHLHGSSVNDIGLIKMKDEVAYGDFITPICLPSKDYRNAYFTATTNFAVAGWGSGNNVENSEVKRSASLPYVPMDVCLESYKNLKPDQVLCAGGVRGKDSCWGDSGGPLMYADVSDDNEGFFVLVGVASAGYRECGATQNPDVYTYVFKYIDWIEKMMKNNGQE